VPWFGVFGIRVIASLKRLDVVRVVAWWRTIQPPNGGIGRMARG